MSIIIFYGVKGDYGFLSNFYKSSFPFRDRIWSTSEHAYQAMKFMTEEEISAIHKCSTPSKSKRLGGKQGGLRLRDNWDESRNQAMYSVLIAKFRSNIELGKKLMATYPVELVNHTIRDSYWGDGADGKGENTLGKILMMVREKLINDTKSFIDSIEESLSPLKSQS